VQGQYIYTNSLVVNLKKVLVEPSHRKEDNIKMDLQEPGYCSRYSDWLWTGRPSSRHASAGSVKNFPCPDRLWGLPSLLSNGYRGLFSRG
jgi:hypothetical protein